MRSVWHPYWLPASLLLLMTVATGCPDPGDDDSADGIWEDPPGELDAAFEADASELFVGETVHLDAGISVDEDGVQAYYADCEIVQFVWDFGDGTTETTELYFVDHTYTTVGEFTVGLTVITDDGDEDDETGLLTVMHPLPNVEQLDVSVDGVAVIGEWVSLIGSEFREANLPAVTFGGPAATQLQFIDSTEILVRVPPKSTSGQQVVEIDFPEDDGGDTAMLTWVKRYSVSTDAFHHRVNFLSFGDGVDFTSEAQDLIVENATLVKITGDGATAIIGDGRYDINIHPTLTFVDLTADFAPVITKVTTEFGIGPLFDIATAVDIALIGDAGGMTVIDLVDPYAPFAIQRVNYDLGDSLAATDLELTPDGTLAVVLGTFDDSIRFYEVSFAGATLIEHSVAAGAGIQDVQITDDGQFAYVLSGGGEGAIPPLLDVGNTCVTVVDLALVPPGNLLGDGVCVPIDAHAPFPFDLAIAPDSSTYISSFDENFGTIAVAFEDIANDPLDIDAWVDLAEALMGLSFGGVVTVDAIYSGEAIIGQSWFLPYGVQTGIDVRYDELLYVANGIYLDIVVDMENIFDPFAAITMSNGVVVAYIETGDVFDVMYDTDPLLYYESFQLQYDYGPLVNLLLPPYSFGDAAIQPRRPPPRIRPPGHPVARTGHGVNYENR